MKLIRSINEVYTVRQILKGKDSDKKPTIHLSHVADYDSLKLLRDATDAVLKYQLEFKNETDRKKILHYLTSEMGDSVDGQRFLRVLKKYFNVIIEK